MNKERSLQKFSSNNPSPIAVNYLLSKQNHEKVDVNSASHSCCEYYQCKKTGGLLHQDGCKLSVLLSF